MVQQLGIILPSIMAKQPCIAFPLAIPMGWSKSPPLFCMFTEMVADITDMQLKLKMHGQLPALPKHPMEPLADHVVHASETAHKGESK